MNSLCIAIAATLAVFVLTEAKEKRGSHGGCECTSSDKDFAKSVKKSLLDDRKNCRKALKAGEASFTPVSDISGIQYFLSDNFCCDQFGWFTQIEGLVDTINECIASF